MINKKLIKILNVLPAGLDIMGLSAIAVLLMFIGVVIAVILVSAYPPLLSGFIVFYLFTLSLVYSIFLLRLINKPHYDIDDIAGLIICHDQETKYHREDVLLEDLLLKGKELLEPLATKDEEQDPGDINTPWEGDHV